MREKLAAGAVPLGKFVITKQLTRRPEEYPDAKSQPHVQVALRRKAQNRRDGTLPVRAPHACACWLRHVDQGGKPRADTRSVCVEYLKKTGLLLT